MNRQKVREMIARQKELKTKAKQDLKGNWGKAIGALFLFALVYLVLAVVLVVISISTGEIELVDTGISYLLAIFFIYPLIIGGYKFLLNLVQNSNAKITDLFSGFKKYWYSIMVMAVKSIYIFLWTIIIILPIAIITLLIQNWMDFSSIVTIAVVFIWFLLVIITVIAAIVVTIRFLLAEFIIMDVDDITPRESISLSSKMMKDHKIEFVNLYLNFFGWYLLGFIAVLIAGLCTSSELFIALYLAFVVLALISLIWVLPYFFTATANFYQKRKEEFFAENPNYLEERRRLNLSIDAALTSFLILCSIMFVVVGFMPEYQTDAQIDDQTALKEALINELEESLRESEGIQSLLTIYEEKDFDRRSNDIFDLVGDAIFSISDNTTERVEISADQIEKVRQIVVELKEIQPETEDCKKLNDMRIKLEYAKYQSIIAMAKYIKSNSTKDYEELNTALKNVNNFSTEYNDMLEEIKNRIEEEAVMLENLKNENKQSSDSWLSSLLNGYTSEKEYTEKVKKSEDYNSAGDIVMAMARAMADGSLFIPMSGVESKVRANSTSFVISDCDLVNPVYLSDKVPDIKQFDTPNRGWRVDISSIGKITVEVLDDIDNPTKVIQVYPATE